MRSAKRLTARDLGWVASGAVALWLIPPIVALAQSPNVNDLKAKIFDARMAEKMFVNGLRFCNELDGTNFYFEPRNRVLKLEDYHRSLENLASAQAYNPETRRAVDRAGRQRPLGAGEKAGAGRQGKLRAGGEPPGSREAARADGRQQPSAAKKGLTAARCLGPRRRVADWA